MSVVRRAIPLLAALISLSVHAQRVPPQSGSGFPGRLERFFSTSVILTADERRLLSSGAPIGRLLDADPSKEVAVFGAVWVQAPVARYLDAVIDIERFETGSAFRITRKISDPARAEDFRELVLPAEDVRDLRACKLGDCEIKMSAEGLARLQREVDWSRPDAKAQVERTVRAMALDYVTAYREGGNRRLAVYRDGRNPTFVATEFRELIDNMPAIAEFLPEMRQYLLEYPAPPLRPTTSFLYWQEADFGLKPTIRINHVAIQSSAEGAVVASKQLYSSHYFWTALELRVLVPDPARGPGFWLVTANRSRSDGLTGFVGRLIRGKVRDAARKGIEAALVATKRTLETR